MTNRLKDKVAIVTGGTSGIGKSIATLFAAEGCRTVIASSSKEKGLQVASDLGPLVTYHKADVSSEQEVKSLIETTISTFGRLDCLCNNAGIPDPLKPISDISSEWFDKAMSVLLRGVFMATKYAAPFMQRQRFGSIINMASIAGLQAGYSGHVYSAAKAAVIHMTRTVGVELGEYGVRVNCICPGGIATPMFGKSAGLSPEQAELTVDGVKEFLATVQPIKRAGEPEDIANAALWLASDESSFMNGSVMVIDGGATCGRLWSDTQRERRALGVSILRTVKASAQK